MQLNHEIPDFAYAFRIVGADSVVFEDRVNAGTRRVVKSFIVTPQALLEDWRDREIRRCRTQVLNFPVPTTNSSRPRCFPDFGPPCECNIP